MIKFGTGGWRAVIGDGFTKYNLQLLAAAMSHKMKAERVDDQGIVIGYDRRFLSKESMQWMAEVFAANGIHTWLINRSAPTPLAMFYTMEHDLPYGMMVTASHNPAIYNGVKVFTRGGRDADMEVTADIESYAGRIEAQRLAAYRLAGEKHDELFPIPFLPYADAVREGLIEEIFPINEYLDSILSDINTAAIRRANLRVALDPMYGVSETSIKTLLITARCDVATIHGNHDTLFGGKLPAPNEKAMRALSATVVDGGFDIGIATDGDADRIGVIDNNGRYLSPNDLLVVLYYYLEKYKGRKGPAVRNLCTTHVLDRLAEMFGEACYEVPVGFKWISSKMSESNALIGGESSGGLSIRGHIHGKDGIYAAALLVEMLAVTGKKMSEIFDDIREVVGRSVFVENNYRFRAEDKAKYLRIIMEDRAVPELPYEIDHVSYMDGCKVYFVNGGWISIRFSGTEPLLRVFAEMPTREMADEVCGIYKDCLKLGEV
ncbi:phosphoglucomutase/phosphomannomutase family protein [Lachnoclostridium sp. Marseille-P6806]|uniref:phosphoglucomutase/phosphomannomutase family protein n=1 Tax=Lachnoclostridium sp. Marseille-P6806 TaxID=2364793 RepID=UPI0010315D4F|nr:phosphoglucomutase/phosphomannomutase family protein [Lachnoclostridium sp. Marseille-P6806]